MSPLPVLTLPVAVLAGGLGTRVRHLTGPDRPKALMEVAGRPFIDFKLEELRRGGATKVVMLIGHGGEAIVEHVGGGERYGLQIEHRRDPPRLLGTGGALRRALPDLGPAFIVTYGDTLLEVPMADLEQQLTSNDAAAVMTVLENQDRWETSNTDVADGFVTAYEKPATPGTHRYLDYGMLAMRATAFQQIPTEEPFDLATLIRSLVPQRQVLAMPVSRRFYDVGNEQSWRETERYLQTLDPR